MKRGARPGRPSPRARIFALEGGREARRAEPLPHVSVMTFYSGFVIRCVLDYDSIPCPVVYCLYCPLSLG